jgi:hypothetical protein
MHNAGRTEVGNCMRRVACFLCLRENSFFSFFIVLRLFLSSVSNMLIIRAPDAHLLLTSPFCSLQRSLPASCHPMLIFC